MIGRMKCLTTHDHGTAALKAQDVAASGKNLAEDGTRQGIGNRNNAAVKVLVADHAAVHEHSLRHRQVSVSSSEG